MSSALKPVLSQGGPQNPPPQMNKPLHGQGPATYGQPSAHLPQNLVSMQHGLPTPAHNSASVQNHYLNVPNAPYNAAGMSIPASNHPIPSIGQPTAYSPQPKSAPPQFASGFQPGLTSQPAAQPAAAEPHSNGTPDAPAADQQNHAAVAPKDSPAAAAPEKPKQDTKPATPVSSLTDESSDDAKHRDESAPDVIDSSSSASIEGMEITTSNSSTAENKTEEAEVPSESANVTEAAAKADGARAEGAAQNVPAPPTDSANTQQPKEQITSKANTKVMAPRTLSKKLKIPKTDPTTTTTADSLKTLKPEKSSIMKSPSRTKRARIKTQPYQYPLPELEIISKMTSSTRKLTKKDNDEKLIIFYKNEFLAVRNTEGGFYICQAVQNIYKGSSKIKIRWLSQDGVDESGEVYTPDFYDSTDFDCILTNLELTRMDKTRFRLPAKEKSRTDSILKRALAVEKGETVPPSPTEEHPDGLDLSLYKEESQLQKPKGKKRKLAVVVPSRARKAPRSEAKKRPDRLKVRKATPAAAPKPKPKVAGKRVPPARKAPAPTTPAEARKALPSAAVARSERAKRRRDVAGPSEAKAAPVIDAKKAKVLAKVVKKVAAKASMPVKRQIPAKKDVKHSAPARGTKPPATKRAKREPTPEPVPERKTKRTRK